MPSRLHLTTYFAIASLILGNALGWVHVGCHASGDACCQSAKASAESLIVAEAGHECCHHSHSPFKHRTSFQPQEDQSKPIRQSERQPAGDEHDSDNCFVCHSVFALRQGLITDAIGFVWEPGITQLSSVCVSSVQPEAAFLSGLSVRGPPQA